MKILLSVSSIRILFASQHNSVVYRADYLLSCTGELGYRFVETNCALGSVVFAILLTGAMGFALGENWPPIGHDQDIIAVPEDWHGNVKRSNWGMGQ